MFLPLQLQIENSKMVLGGATDKKNVLKRGKSPKGDRADQHQKSKSSKFWLFEMRGELGFFPNVKALSDFVTL